MFNLLKSSNSLVVAENIQSYLDQRTPNITLFSQDGYKIRIHKVCNYIVLCKSVLYKFKNGTGKWEYLKSKIPKN